MTEGCPCCGAGLPGVRGAFFSRGRGPLPEEGGEDERPRGGPEEGPGLPVLRQHSKGGSPVDRLTLPARAVLVLALLGGLAASMAYVWCIVAGLPTGRYPLWFFITPVVL